MQAHRLDLKCEGENMTFQTSEPRKSHTDKWNRYDTVCTQVQHLQKERSKKPNFF